MRVRLFWQLLATFALLIVFGVGGTAALIGVRFRQITDAHIPATIEVNQRTWVSLLSDYYVANGRSWRGVEQRLKALTEANEAIAETSISYGLFDNSGHVIVQGGAGPEGELQIEHESRSGEPILVDDVQVARLLLLPTRGNQWSWGAHDEQRDRRPRGFPWRDLEPAAPVLPAGPPVPLAEGVPEAPMPEVRSRAEPPAIEQQINRTFPLVALGIGSITLGLAVMMSRRISAPLANMTAGARQVAAGNLRVKVPGSSILEVDELATAFNQMATDLAHEDQLRRNMTADIAHELRTPLTIIKGKLEGILDGVYPATAQHVAPVLEEATLLERLVNDLRLLSLAESGQLPLYREEVPVAELLHTIGRAFASEAANQHVKLGVGVAPEVPPVEVDPQRMQQVLGNLVANSLRHTPAGGEIQLRAVRRDHTVSITIQDTGHGIAPAELPYIFDRFWRGDKARSRHGGGAGLGLAIARQLIEAHGGHIHASSERGQGTAITIDLPVP